MHLNRGRVFVALATCITTIFECMQTVCACRSTQVEAILLLLLFLHHLKKNTYEPGILGVVTFSPTPSNARLSEHQVVWCNRQRVQGSWSGGTRITRRPCPMPRSIARRGVPEGDPSHLSCCLVPQLTVTSAVEHQRSHHCNTRRQRFWAGFREDIHQQSWRLPAHLEQGAILVSHNLGQCRKKERTQVLATQLFTRPRVISSTDLDMVPGAASKNPRDRRMDAHMTKSAQDIHNDTTSIHCDDVENRLNDHQHMILDDCSLQFLNYSLYNFETLVLRTRSKITNVW